jgi:hypothetical protein
MTTREVISWVPVQLEKPELRIEVLGDFGGGDVRMTFWDGETWRFDSEDEPLPGAPSHWATKPTGARP